MPKPVIRDIQIKKKVVNPPPYKARKEEPKILKKTKIKEIPTQEFKPSLVVEKFPSQINRNADKLKKTLGIIFVVFLLISTLLYFATKVEIIITPKIFDRTVNANITLTSWSKPFRTSVMKITEKTILLEDIEQTKKLLDDKTKNRFIYDTPKDYYIPKNCSLDTVYTTSGSEDIEKFMTAEVTALIIHKADFLEYLKEIMALDAETIKNIESLRCNIKTDINTYTIGQRTQNLAVNISGIIKTEKIIDQESLKEFARGELKNKVTFILVNNPMILSHSMKLKPFNFFPMIPSKSKNITIKIQSLLDY